MLYLAATFRASSYFFLVHVALPAVLWHRLLFTLTTLQGRPIICNQLSDGLELRGHHAGWP